MTPIRLEAQIKEMEIFMKDEQSELTSTEANEGKSLVCELCADSGFYGDNGPGMHGNSEWQFCECVHGCGEQLMAKIGGPYCKGDLVCLIAKYADARVSAATEQLRNENERLCAEVSHYTSEVDRLQSLLEEARKALHGITTLPIFKGLGDARQLASIAISKLSTPKQS